MSTAAAVDYARSLVRIGKPFAVAVRMASVEHRVSTVDVSIGLRGPRKSRRKAMVRRLPERCTHVPDRAYWQD